MQSARETRPWNYEDLSVRETHSLSVNSEYQSVQSRVPTPTPDIPRITVSLINDSQGNFPYPMMMLTE